MEKNLTARYLAAKRALFDKVYGDLNDMQRQAVFTTEGPLLVLAGAGSGKTTVLVRRIAFIIRYGNAYFTDFAPQNLTEEHVADLEHAIHLSVPEIEQILPEFIHDPCPPYRMLAITFTNKAAGEIKSRLVTQFADETLAGDIWSGTFHSVCVRILRTYGDRIGYTRDFTIYDSNDTKSAISEIMRDENIDDISVKTVQNAISHAKNSMQGQLALSKKSKIARVYNRYCNLLKSSNAVDFDDIIMETIRLLKENADVREYYQRKFKYICVDEYQDTNVAQFQLVSILSNGNGNLMVVGDEDQSIYKFRGATIDNILGFDKNFSGVNTIKLEQNYRSTKTILEAANAVIKQNKSRIGKTLWSSGATGERIIVRYTEDQKNEAESIVETIERMVRVENYRYADFAVLYRTNAQSAQIELALKRTKIPYRVMSGTGFFDRKEVKDTISYLQVIQNPLDRVRLKRVINEPKRGIGKKAVEAVEAIADENNCSMLYVMEHADDYPALKKFANHIKDFADMIIELKEKLYSLDPSDLPEYIETVMTRVGYISMLEEGDKSDRDRIDNILELKTHINNYLENAEEPSLGNYLEECALLMDVDKYDDAVNAVVLMTIHSAKGLEFPVVFLPGMEEGVFPGKKVLELSDPTELEEERRLAYVAITRAKERLFILHAKQRMLYGQTGQNELSRFAVAIPEELIRREDLTLEAMSAASTVVTGKPAGTPAGQSYGYYEHPRRPKTPVHTDRLTVGQPTPAATAEARQSMNALNPGDRVIHATFGEGEILSIKPMGADKLIEVMFDTAGTKKLMGTYAKLKKL